MSPAVIESVAALGDLRSALLPDGALDEVAVAEHGPSPTPRWDLDEVAGRLVEMSAWGSSCATSFALLLVHDAQVRGEPAAWVGDARCTFYPPDAARVGVDLGALVVVRATGVTDAMGAADRLVRSGALGLCVIDVGSARVPMAAPSRLAGLARHHETAVVCLTKKPAAAASLGSLVSLRVHAFRGPVDGDGEACCRLEARKDRRRGGRWTCEEVFRAPDGLR